MVQATWLKAIQGADTYWFGRPVKAWLTGILRNEARLHFRHENVRRRPTGGGDLSAVDPSLEAEWRELLGTVPLRVKSQWRGGSMSSDAVPMPLAGLDLRGRAEPMVVRVEASGREAVVLLRR